MVAVEGERPSPPGLAWFARAARGAGAAWEEVSADPERWGALGVPLVEELAASALRRALGSPDILRVESADTFTPAATRRAEVTFWVVTGDVAGAPLRGVVGPGGAVWGDPPAAAVPIAQSEATAWTLLIGAGYAVAALIGLLVMVIPGLIIGAIGVAHVRHRLRARERMIAARQAQQAPAIRALVSRRLGG